MNLLQLFLILAIFTILQTHFLHALNTRVTFILNPLTGFFGAENFIYFPVKYKKVKVSHYYVNQTNQSKYFKKQWLLYPDFI